MNIYLPSAAMCRGLYRSIKISTFSAAQNRTTPLFTATTAAAAAAVAVAVAVAMCMHVVDRNINISTYCAALGRTPPL